MHLSWLAAVGFSAKVSEEQERGVEVSPLLSYEGEGIAAHVTADGFALLSEGVQLPVHVKANGEVEVSANGGARCASPALRGGAVPASAPGREDVADGLDTRPFYLQEYPRRLEVSCSDMPRFNGGPGSRTVSRSHPDVADTTPQAQDVVAAAREKLSKEILPEVPSL
mmetsp:Transcript_51224/g.143947  ORF Transcript_51224/g.143947 Transcript_51224/m.143947 type:complete len:168 (-) Transcript_51224:44-547(-)